MARTIKITLNGKIYEPSIQALTREKLYGFIEELVLDDKAKPCIVGALLDDGQTLIAKGCTSIKTVDEQGREVDKSLLKAVDPDGKSLSLVPSVFETGIVLQTGSMEDLFDLEVEAVYDFNWEEDSIKLTFLKETQGKVFTFDFNYRTDYEGLNGILISNEEGAFIIAGRTLHFEFLDHQVQTIINLPEVEAEEDSTEMDFAMF
jgi:hypothetical protein